MTQAQLLTQELQALAGSFAPDELAFLALTSKAEFVVRDRLAFRIHRRVGGDKVDLVAREWHHADLAVLRGNAPWLLLELKAMYSFDAMNEASDLANFREEVRRDVRKALALAVQGTEIFSLLLVTHPQGHCDPSLDDVVKYLPRIERTAVRGIQRVREEAAGNIAKAFVGEPVALRDTLSAGTAFGIPVSIDYWLFGPYIGAA
jgi:hypothetical protein